MSIRLIPEDVEVLSKVYQNILREKEKYRNVSKITSTKYKTPLQQFLKWAYENYESFDDIYFLIEGWEKTNPPKVNLKIITGLISNLKLSAIFMNIRRSLSGYKWE